MPTITLDSSLNVPTLFSIITGAITAIVFVVSMKGDIKTLKYQAAELTQEVGELRRLHLEVTQAAQIQAQSVQEVAKKVEDNKKQIVVATKAVRTALPELAVRVGNIENSQPIVASIMTPTSSVLLLKKTEPKERTYTMSAPAGKK